MKGKVSRDKSNFCVVCGAEIPEGFQICLLQYFRFRYLVDEIQQKVRGRRKKSGESIMTGKKKNPKKKRSRAHEAKYERWN